MQIPLKNHQKKCLLRQRVMKEAYISAKNCTKTQILSNIQKKPTNFIKHCKKLCKFYKYREKILQISQNKMQIL